MISPSDKVHRVATAKEPSHADIRLTYGGRLERSQLKRPSAEFWGGTGPMTFLIIHSGDLRPIPATHSPRYRRLRSFRSTLTVDRSSMSGTASRGVRRVGGSAKMPEQLGLMTDQFVNSWSIVAQFWGEPDSTANHPANLYSIVISRNHGISPTIVVFSRSSTNP